MEGDEEEPSGLSGWAWYEFGRMDERASSQTADLARRLFGPRDVTYDVTGIVNENKRLVGEVQKANHHLGLRKQKIESLTADLALRDAEISSLRSKLATLQAEYNIVERLWGGAKAEATEYGLELVDKDQEIQTLRQELQELREGKK